MKHQYIGLLTRDTVALILAGGKGTRLKQLTADRAKPVVPFAGKFKIIDFTLSNCMNSGIRKVNVLTQYKSSGLLSHVQKAWSHMPWELGEYVSIMPAEQKKDEIWCQGTAAAVYQNLQQLRREDCKYVLILGGDHIYKMDYSRMLRQHVKHDSDVSIASIPVESHSASAFGVLSIDDDMQITQFQEKPSIPEEIPNQPGYSLASMGVYIFNLATLEKLLLEDAASNSSQHDFGLNIIPQAIKDYCVTAYIFDDAGCADVQAYWKDVGTIDQYFQANIDLLQITPELNLYDKHWPIYSFQEQLPGAKFIFNDDDCRGHAIDSVVSSGCIICGAKIQNSLLFTCVSIDKFSYLSHCVVLPNVKIGKYCNLSNVLVADDCIIPDGFRIGYDHNEDQKYYEISPNNVVLVTQDMIDLAVKSNVMNNG